MSIDRWLLSYWNYSWTVFKSTLIFWSQIILRPSFPLLWKAPNVHSLSTTFSTITHSWGINLLQASSFALKIPVIGFFRIIKCTSEPKQQYLMYHKTLYLSIETISLFRSDWSQNPLSCNFSHVSWYHFLVFIKNKCFKLNQKKLSFFQLQLHGIELKLWFYIHIGDVYAQNDF